MTTDSNSSDSESETIDKATPERTGKNRISRREALGTGSAAVLTALAGCSLLGDDKTQLTDSKQTSTSSPPSNSELRSGLQAEQEVVSKNEGSNQSLANPTYEYDPIEISADESENGWVRSIQASPADSIEGDRIAIDLKPGVGSDFQAIVQSVWSPDEGEELVEESVEGVSISFQLYRVESEDLSVALGLREGTDAEEPDRLLITRSKSVDTTLELVNTFEQMYSTS